MSTQTGTYFLGTYGFPVVVSLGANLTGATGVNLSIVKPDGATVNRALATSDITTANPGVVTFSPSQSEVNQVGAYSFKITVVFAGREIVTEGNFSIEHVSDGPTLVVENGSGVVGANTYSTVAQGDTYHSQHLYADAWNSATYARKAVALIHGVRVIEAHFQYNGRRTYDPQALAWPRTGVFNLDRRPVSYYDGSSLALLVASGWQMISGEMYGPNYIPQRVIAAQFEFARLLLEKNREQDRPEMGITHLGIGQGAIDITFDPKDRPKVFGETVNALLSPLGCMQRRRGQATVSRA